MSLADERPQASPDSQELLEGLVTSGGRRGHHKIIIGAAPGVGKTYRMLEEAHQLQRLGMDVVVGYIETHGRRDTMALLDGLEILPRQQLPYKGITLEEMDKDAIIRRCPQTVLIDELAHTNVHGSDHTKRYEDVESILSAGINVVSTVNIQHIESLHDIVARITGISIHERVPDAVMDAADEVVLVDISAEELQDRMRSGKIYAPDKVDQALNHFFKKGNLVALRELALREVANSVEEQAEQESLFCPLELTGIHERIMVCISTHPDAQRLIRRGYRIADRMSGDLLVLYIKLAGKTLPDSYLKNLEKHEVLCKQLEGEFLEVECANIVEGVVRVARERKVTQIIVGESLQDVGWWRFFKPAIPYQIFQKIDNIDVYIVARELKSNSGNNTIPN